MRHPRASSAFPSMLNPIDRASAARETTSLRRPVLARCSLLQRNLVFETIQSCSPRPPPRGLWILPGSG